MFALVGLLDNINHDGKDGRGALRSGRERARVRPEAWGLVAPRKNRARSGHGESPVLFHCMDSYTSTRSRLARLACEFASDLCDGVCAASAP
jgi:hypothetical protein